MTTGEVGRARGFIVRVMTLCAVCALTTVVGVEPAMAAPRLARRVVAFQSDGSSSAQNPVAAPDDARNGRQAARAQGARALRGALPADPNEAVTAAEAELLFDRVVLNQARRALALDPAHFATFRPRLQRLQAIRRRTQIERRVLVRELAALGSTTPADDTTIEARLDALKAFDSKSAADMTRAYADIDEALTPAQQAEFRVFEENMARQKQNLINRARQEANQARQGP